MVINPIVGVYIPIIRIPYERRDDHPQYSDFWPWHICVDLNLGEEIFLFSNFTYLRPEIRDHSGRVSLKPGMTPSWMTSLMSFLVFGVTKRVLHHRFWSHSTLQTTPKDIFFRMKEWTYTTFSFNTKNQFWPSLCFFFFFFSWRLGAIPSKHHQAGFFVLLRCPS